MNGDLDNTPQPLANEQVSAHYPPGDLETQGFSDRDNFVNDMVTILSGGQGGTVSTAPVDPSTIVVPLPPSAAGRTPVLTLTQVKLWLRIESSQTDEDTLLTELEMAARLYTENYLRQTLDPNALDSGGQPLGIGENIQMAMKLLIAQWYRNRELMVSGRLAEPPFAFAALLSGIRDYPSVY